MFSNVGMNPYGPGGSVVTQQPQTPVSPIEPGKDRASVAAGERAASATRPETTLRVDPARQIAPAMKAPVEERRTDRPPGPPPTLLTTVDDLLEAALAPPPDPETPAGPPPAFQRSPLEAERQAARQPDSTDEKPAVENGSSSAPSTAEVTGAPRDGAPLDTIEDAVRRLLADERLETPPSPEDRARETFASVQKMSAPTSPKSVDVAR